jgi:hypothetical protein
MVFSKVNGIAACFYLRRGNPTLCSFIKAAASKICEADPPRQYIHQERACKAVLPPLALSERVGRHHNRRRDRGLGRIDRVGHRHRRQVPGDIHRLIPAAVGEHQQRAAGLGRVVGRVWRCRIEIGQVGKSRGAVGRTQDRNSQLIDVGARSPLP